MAEDSNDEEAFMMAEDSNDEEAFIMAEDSNDEEAFILAEDSNDDAPLEVSLSQAKDTFESQIDQEKAHTKRHKESARQRVPKWQKQEFGPPQQPKQRNPIEEAAAAEELKMEEDVFAALGFDRDEDEDGDEDEDEDIPRDERLNIPGWIDESDLFHTKPRVMASKPGKETIDESSIMQSEQNEVDESLFEGMNVPQEVVALFESAIKTSKSKKSFQDKWRLIIKTRLNAKKYKNLRKKLSKLDKVFVDGFQIETDGTYRLNRAAIRRSLRVKMHFGRNVQRTSHRKLRCAGFTKPSFGFQGLKSKGKRNRISKLKVKIQKNKRKDMTFWDQRIAHVSKISTKAQIKKWQDF